MATMPEAADIFWHYSLRLYERPGVAEALLTLQDRHGADVNIVLYALFAGARQGRRLDAADLERLTTAAESWNQLAVRPLRALRRDVKPLAAERGVMAFREQLKQSELAAERVAQSRLVAAVPFASSSRADEAAAYSNLRQYLAGVDETLFHPLLEAAAATD